MVIGEDRKRERLSADELYSRPVLSSLEATSNMWVFKFLAAIYNKGTYLKCKMECEAITTIKIMNKYISLKFSHNHLFLLPTFTPHPHTQLTTNLFVFGYCRLVCIF